jgi:transposase InsO family protein
MSERKRFIDEYLEGTFGVTELSQRYGISRKTAYKWIGRFLESCELGDRSSRPHRSPRAVAEWIEDSIVEARKQKPRWGPRKLRDALLRANPGAELPSVSAFALIFKRNGLVKPRRKRRRSPPPFSAPLAHATGPNKVWCIDFKGHFPVGSTRCYPLTITDAHSRYLIACVAMTRTDGRRVQKIMEAVFNEFGLPEAIRSDNGPPFATTGLAGLSTLNAWWARLGIRHERIQPGKPQQNGRHERMHLTLKQETADPPRSALYAQQRAFDRFRKEYNFDRPHQALGGRVPADFYERSSRCMPDVSRLREPFAYPERILTTQVTRSGYVEWNGRRALLTAALADHYVGLDFDELGDWTVYFCGTRLGALRRGERNGLKFIPHPSVTQVSRINRHPGP